MDYCNKKRDGTDYSLFNIVNANNIVEKIDHHIWEAIWKAEFKKGEHLTEEENSAIVRHFFDIPIYCVLDNFYSNDADYYPIFATKNVYQKTNERMRFFFTIKDCKHCEYCRNGECVNVESDNYGFSSNKEECDNFVEIEG